jgi:acyl transferase domain-containing protein
VNKAIRKPPTKLMDNEKVPKVAVVGMSVCFGNCSCLRQFQEMVFREKRQSPNDLKIDGKAPILNSKNLLNDHCLDGNYLKDIDITVGDFRIPPNEIPDILPQQLLMLKVSAQALADAGFPLRQKRPRMGTIIGISFDFEATNFHLRWNLENQADAFKAKLE